MYKELYSELRTIKTEIVEYRKNNPDYEKRDNQIIDIVNAVVELYYLCSKEGYLALEDEITKYDWLPHYKYLEKLVLLITDGTAQERMAEIAIERYYMLNLHDYDALIALIYIEYARDIVLIDYSSLFLEAVLALLPSDIEERYQIQKYTSGAEY